MSYVNGTTHYNLPQTVGTDKRDWTDTNQAFADIDSAIHTAFETAEAGATNIQALQTDVNALDTRVTSAEANITNNKTNIGLINTKINSIDADIADVRADALDMICAVDEGTAQVATVAVQEGNYFRYNNVLYIATSNIAIGDTIVPNTNCKATNVVTEIKNRPTLEDIGLNIGGIGSGFKWVFGKASVAFDNNTLATDTTTIPAILTNTKATSVYAFVASPRSDSNLAVNLDGTTIKVLSTSAITGNVVVDFIGIVQ